MKIIYHCFGGTHSSVTAACIHLGLLPRDRVPGCRELLDQKLFDRREMSDIGKITFVGRDGLGNEVYVVGRRNRPKLLCNVAEGLSVLFGIKHENLMLVDVSSYVSPSMRAGGFMSRRMGLVAIGRPLVTWGTIRNYRRLAAAVEKVLSEITRTREKAPGKKEGNAAASITPEAAC